MFLIRLFATVAFAETDENGLLNKKGISDAFVYFGQFVVHDLHFNPRHDLVDGPVPFFTLSRESFLEQLPIEVPEDDPAFTGVFQTDVLEYYRGAWVRENNTDIVPRQYLNEVTSYLDLGTVYGHNNVRAAALRKFEKGMLKTDFDSFLPRNGRGPEGIDINLENVPNAGNEFYVAGDVRANSNVGLLLMHTLWLKEHNLVST